jgi:tRNA(Ile)-lysidine synthase
VSLLTQVCNFIRYHGLLAPGDGVVVGVSGGADSLCLLHLLHRLKGEWQLRIRVAHLHHGARGAAADEDAAFVADMARRWNLPATIAQRDVPAIAQANGLAFEEAARRVRYAFLAHVAGEVGAERIAVGHNADDQAETVLMHFLRGAGPAGLRGMLPATPLSHYRLMRRISDFTFPPQLPTLIRPLLDTPREEIERYCDRHGLTPRFDRSNLDTTYFRNRIRHELIPLLESYNPNIRRRLQNTARVITADYDLLTQLRRQAWREVALETSRESVVFALQPWRAQPLSLQRGLIRDAAHRLRPQVRDFDFVHIENAVRLAREGDTGTQATLPGGLVLTVGYARLTIADEDYEPAPEGPTLPPEAVLPVKHPGVTPLPGGDWVLEAGWLDDWSLEDIQRNPDRWTAYLDAAALGPPLTLRTRRPGERFRPQGMGGHAPPLADWMINAKIPHSWRDRLPLLTADEEIVWVCGWRVSESAIVRSETRRVARFQLRRAE